MESAQDIIRLHLDYGKLSAVCPNAAKLKGIFIPIISVGGARCGKSTSLNIIIRHLAKPELLDPSKSYFKAQRGTDPVTDGIHACLIRYCDMKFEAQQKFDLLFGPENKQEKHVVLLDCEGTDVGNIDECNKLYTAALAIASKGVFMISTLIRIYQPLIKTFFDNYETHKELLEKNEKATINMSIFVKDQEDSDLDFDEKKQEEKRKKHFKNLARADEFLQVVKPLVYCLSEIDLSHRKALDKGDFGIKSPYVDDVIGCFWNNMICFKNVFVNSDLKSLRTLEDYLATVTQIINGKFKNSKDYIISLIDEWGANFKMDIQSLMKEQQPGKDLIPPTIQKIQETLNSSKTMLENRLVNMKESKRSIKISLEIFTAFCKRILEGLFMSPRMIKFMQYEYLTKMFEKQSIWKISSEALEALQTYKRDLDEEELKELGKNYPIITAFEEADAEVRKMMKVELDSLVSKHPDIPLDALKNILDRQGAGAPFDLLKYNVKKHVLYLFCLVKAEYTSKQRENWFGFGLTVAGLATAGTGAIVEIVLRRALMWAAGGMLTGLGGWIVGKVAGRDIDLDISIEEKRLEHLRETFKKEIQRKESMVMLSDDGRFLKHIEALIHKTNEVYLPEMCL